VIALTGHADTPIARGTDHALVNFAEDDTSCESFHMQALLIALAVMQARGECPDHARLVSELRTMPGHFLAAKRAFEAEAEALAERLKDEPWHIITAAGFAWPAAWYYGMCILEEMQWIKTRPIHAADFFHGTLELVEKGVSVILFKTEDEYRPAADRVEKFLPQFTDKITVLDTQRFAMPGVSPEVRGLMGPAILATLLERLSAHLEVKRNHPLTHRRYYKRVSY
jgi:fructoselysine-6-phosphate deglycase